MDTALETYICAVCDNDMDEPHLSGQTLIGKALAPYFLCYECFIKVPSDNDPPQMGKSEDIMQAFWDNLKEKLKLRNRYSL